MGEELGPGAAGCIRGGVGLGVGFAWLAVIREGDEIVAAIIGPTKCGKTSVARWVCREMWRRHGLRSIVLDPQGKNWGGSAWVTDDLETFERVIWGVSGCAVFWDDSTDSLQKNGAAHKKLFSRIRHEHPACFVVAHDYAVLSPMMRGNLSEAYIFKQDLDRANDWARQFVDRDLLACSDLERFEFLHKIAFEKVERRRLPAGEL